MPTGTTRGLAAALATWDDDALTGLLTARPDLARPVPRDLRSLAARALSAPSLQQLGLQLSRADAQLVHAVGHGLEPGAVASAEARLRSLALVWDEDGRAVTAEPVVLLVDRVDLGEPAAEPPPATVIPTSEDSAGFAAAQALSLVEEALRRIEGDPPRVLKAGGMPAADVRSLARELDVDGARCALLLELARAARLLRETDDEAPLWAPTTEADLWAEQPAPERWAALASAWLEMHAAPHLVGTPAAQGKGTTNALAPEVVWSPIRTLRRHVLEELATLDGGASASDLVARVQWRHALVGVRGHLGVVEAVLAEATWLGLVAGGLSAPGRVLLATGSAEAAAAAVAAALPPAATTIRLGADLTAVAAGRLEGDVADLLNAAADIESRGGATVFRFSPASVGRALDAGWSGERLLAELSRLAADEVPQPLAFLVEDAGRRHGALTLGGVSSYLRCDEPSVLAELAGTPRLGLRLVAPTVAVSGLAPTVLLARLRAIGRVPAVEGPDGEVHVVGAEPLRSTARRSPVAVRPPDAAQVTEIAAALRARGLPDLDEATEPDTMRALLQDAVQARTSVRVDYVGAGGQPESVELAPTALEPGRVRGRVDGVERVITLARVSRVRV